MHNNATVLDKNMIRLCLDSIWFTVANFNDGPSLKFNKKIYDLLSFTLVSEHEHASEIYLFLVNKLCTFPMNT